MLDLKLSTLAVLLGLVYVLPNLYAFLKPVDFGKIARKFPRYTPLGYPLMILATVWFVYYVSLESVSDFASFKPVLYALFIGVGVGACLFVHDYLPVRGLAALLLLAAKLMVDTARWVDTPWRLVIVTWAYLWVIAGMWFTISPWRLRDHIQWLTANQQRIRLFSGLRVAFGLLVIILGLTVYRSAETRSADVHVRSNPALIHTPSVLSAL